MKNLTFIILLFVSSPALTQADSLINHSIIHYGGKQINTLHYKFEFRNIKFEVKRENGVFEYRRILTDSNSTFTDVLNNEGFYRMVSGKKVSLDDKEVTKYSNSLNSVVYFTLIPFVLKDEAVQPEYIGTAIVKNETYHKIQITFDSESGGPDHQDVYVYWINRENLEIDYLAYSFHVNGGGMRFREAFNQRRIEGLLFQDYHNYKPDSSKVSVDNLDSEFTAGRLLKISEIITEKVSVLPN